MSPHIQLQFNMHAVTQQSCGTTVFAKFALLGPYEIPNCYEISAIISFKTLDHADETTIQLFIGHYSVVIVYVRLNHGVATRHQLARIARYLRHPRADTGTALL